MGASGPMPSGGFRCIVADPPWPFNDRGSRATPGYRFMTADQIRNLFEKVDKAFRSHLNEAATEIIAPGSRSERRRSKDIQTTQLEEHHGSADGEEFSPDLWRRDFQKLEMLASLTQEEAKIMEMAVFEGLTAKEIAKSRGRAESTVRVQILYARKKLRSVM